jgi:hypothetical protein
MVDGLFVGYYYSIEGKMNKSITKGLSKGLARLRQTMVRTKSIHIGRHKLRQKDGKDTVSIAAFTAAIMQLPSDPPRNDSTVWYLTQKEHWLGWLSEYNGTGGYRRQTTKSHDAKYAYNHIVCYQMLLWIIEAAGVDPIVVRAARQASVEPATMQGKWATIRRSVPWATLQHALWRNA